MAAGNRQHARTQDIGNPVDHMALVTRIGDARGELLRDPQPPLGLSEQQQHSAIRFQPTTIESSTDFASTNGWEGEGKTAIVADGGRGTFCPE
jgi:hypothetical protein